MTRHLTLVPAPSPTLADHYAEMDRQLAVAFGLAGDDE